MRRNGSLVLALTAWVLVSTAATPKGRRTASKERRQRRLSPSFNILESAKDSLKQSEEKAKAALDKIDT
jgi:hypothetical protein